MTGKELYCKLTGDRADEYRDWEEFTTREKKVMSALARLLTLLIDGTVKYGL